MEEEKEIKYLGKKKGKDKTAPDMNTKREKDHEKQTGKASSMILKRRYVLPILIYIFSFIS